MTDGTTTDTENQSRTTLSRRRALQLLGTTGAVSLAGCPGGNGDGDNGAGGDNGAAGERVPEPITFDYYTGVPGTPDFELMIPVLEENFSEALRTDISFNGKDVSRFLDESFGDQRTSHVNLWYLTFTPLRIDPREFTRGFYDITEQGADGTGVGQYANCEFSWYGRQADQALSIEEREEFVYEAQSIYSNDKACIPLAPRTIVGLARDDVVDLGGAGAFGISRSNPNILYETTANQDSIVMRTEATVAQTRNFFAINNPQGVVQWSNYMHTPLLGYGPDLEIQNRLAEDFEMSDDGQTVTVDIAEATFHNGDPVTAEDVKFTFEVVWGNQDTLQQGEPQPLDSIEVLDDRTVEFNFTEPNTPVIYRSFTFWGIIHKNSWEGTGVMDDPANAEAPDPLIGSGPFQLDEFQQDSFVYITPFDGSPIPEPDMEVELRVIRDQTTAIEAFRNNELHLMPDITLSIGQSVKEDLGDTAQLHVGGAATPYVLFPQYNWGPMKHEAMRDAIGTAVDRKLIDELVSGDEGLIEYHSTMFLQDHPWRAPNDMLHKFTDEPAGDVEGARQKLRDAGFSWDGNNNLRYPVDADLDPLWPKDENPTGDDGFECLDSEGNWVGDYEPS